jgi:riboflavin synthase
MFTGIIEVVGTVESVGETEGARRIRIAAPAPLLDDLVPGASVAVDGACLTPVVVDRRGFEVDVVLSTLSRTLAAGYEPGRRVNLERALALGGRLDGHLVQGHVDGIGRLVEVDEAGETRFLTFAVPPEVYEVTILHGSIALNGISLTVNALTGPDRSLNRAAACLLIPSKTHCRTSAGAGWSSWRTTRTGRTRETSSAPPRR